MTNSTLPEKHDELGPFAYRDGRRLLILIVLLIAGWLLLQFGFVLVGGILAEIVNAIIGAVILLLVIGLVRRAA